MAYCAGKRLRRWQVYIPGYTVVHETLPNALTYCVRLRGDKVKDLTPRKKFRWRETPFI